MLTQARALAATLARLSYTSLFERVRVIAGSSVGSVPYGAITAVQGATSTSTITLPNATTAALKMCNDVGVLNVDGAHPITIVSPDGKTINGGSSVTLPAVAGSFAHCFFETASQEWYALLAVGTAGGAGTIGPSNWNANTGVDLSGDVLVHPGATAAITAPRAGFILASASYRFANTSAVSPNAVTYGINTVNNSFAGGTSVSAVVHSAEAVPDDGNEADLGTALHWRTPVAAGATVTFFAVASNNTGVSAPGTIQFVSDLLLQFSDA